MSGARRLWLSLALAASFSATAETHKWADAKGRLHYGDVVPPGAKLLDESTAESRSAQRIRECLQQHAPGIRLRRVEGDARLTRIQAEPAEGADLHAEYERAVVAATAHCPGWKLVDARRGRGTYQLALLATWRSDRAEHCEAPIVEMLRGHLFADAALTDSIGDDWLCELRGVHGSANPGQLIQWLAAHADSQGYFCWDDTTPAERSAGHFRLQLFRQKWPRD